MAEFKENIEIIVNFYSKAYPYAMSDVLMQKKVNEV